DLAGLIVIDFIDMEDSRNDREVERRLREAVKNDRARVQIGKISQFGLLEMSRQRLRAGVVASSSIACPHCGGAGIVRSVESTALRVLRALEEEGEKNRASALTVRVAHEVAIYALNQKRRELARIEAEYGMDVSFEPKEGLMAGHFELERTRVRDPEDRPRNHAVSIEAGFVPSDEPEDEIAPEEMDDEIDESEEDVVEAESGQPAETVQPSREGGGRRRRRRGGRGRNRDRDHGSARPENSGQEQRTHEAHANGEAGPADAMMPAIADEQSEGQADLAAAGNGQPGEGGHRRRRRRRGRRGGRNREQDNQNPGSFAPETERFGAPDEIDTTPNAAHAHAPGAPSAPVWSLHDDIPDTTPVADTAPKDEADKPVKKGWWQRAFS